MFIEAVRTGQVHANIQERESGDDLDCLFILIFLTREAWSGCLFAHECIFQGSIDCNRVLFVQYTVRRNVGKQDERT